MRYFVNGVPPGPAAGALFPVLPTTPRGTTYPQVIIYGQPGTQGVAAPKPHAVPMVSQTRMTQPSYCSPDVIFPSKYWTTADNMHAPVNLLQDNEMPVPAVSRYRLSQEAMRRRRTGGQGQVAWPRVLQRFPSIGAPGA